jgi:hypothetical protein
MSSFWLIASSDSAVLSGLLFSFVLTLLVLFGIISFLSCRILQMAAPSEDTLMPNEVATRWARTIYGWCRHDGGPYEMDSLAHIESYHRL